MAKKPKKSKSLTRDELRAALSRFRTAAGQRLACAEFIAVNAQGAFGLDAIYLGGYGVECALKALLLARTPEKKQGDVYKSFFGGKEGHNLETFKKELAKTECYLPPEVARSFRTTASWTTSMRYGTRHVVASEATAFLRAARDIVDWGERSR